MKWLLKRHRETTRDTYLNQDEEFHRKKKINYIYNQLKVPNEGINNL
jgi:hypothetical protein